MEGIDGSVAEEVRITPVRDAMSKPFPWDPNHVACMSRLITKEGKPWLHCGRH